MKWDPCDPKRDTGTKTHENETRARKWQSGKRSDDGASSRKGHTSMHVQTREEGRPWEDRDYNRRLTRNVPTMRRKAFGIKTNNS